VISEFVIAGLDPAIHAETQHENVLGLHPGKPPARHALRRHHERPHPPHLRTSRSVVEGFSKTYGVKTLVYYEQHATAMSDSAREEHQTLVAQVEDRFDSFD
jgi:hypothetical protein